MQKKYRIIAVIATLIMGLVAGACIFEVCRPRDPHDITIMLEWTPTTNHTGLYAAQSLGYFDDEGLKVSIVQPPQHSGTLLTASGSAQFGLDCQDFLAFALASNTPLPVKAVAAVMQQNPLGVIARAEKNIISASKLEGQTYSSWNNDIERGIIAHMMKIDGGDFSKVNVINGFVDNVPAALLSGIDATLTYYNWDGIACELAGVSATFIPLRETDSVLDFYTPIIIGNCQYMEKHPDLTRKFLRAVSRGYTYAANNPIEACGILAQHTQNFNYEFLQKSQEWVSKQYIGDAKAWGYMDPVKFNKFYDFIYDQGLIQNKISSDLSFTNEFLPD